MAAFSYVCWRGLPSVKVQITRVENASKTTTSKAKKTRLSLRSKIDNEPRSASTHCPYFVSGHHTLDVGGLAIMKRMTHGERKNSVSHLAVPSESLCPADHGHRPPRRAAEEECLECPNRTGEAPGIVHLESNPIGLLLCPTLGRKSALAVAGPTSSYAFYNTRSSTTASSHFRTQLVLQGYCRRGGSCRGRRRWRCVAPYTSPATGRSFRDVQRLRIGLLGLPTRSGRRRYISRCSAAGCRYLSVPRELSLPASLTGKIIPRARRRLVLVLVLLVLVLVLVVVLISRRRHRLVGGRSSAVHTDHSHVAAIRLPCSCKSWHHHPSRFGGVVTSALPAPRRAALIWDGTRSMYTS